MKHDDVGLTFEQWDDVLRLADKIRDTTATAEDRIGSAVTLCELILDEPQSIELLDPPEPQP